MFEPNCVLLTETSESVKNSTVSFRVQVAFGRGTPEKLQSRVSVVSISTIISESDVVLTSGASEDQATTILK